MRKKWAGCIAVIWYCSDMRDQRVGDNVDEVQEKLAHTGMKSSNGQAGHRVVRIDIDTYTYFIFF